MMSPDFISSSPDAGHSRPRANLSRASIRLYDQPLRHELDGTTLFVVGPNPTP